MHPIHYTHHEIHTHAQNRSRECQKYAHTVEKDTRSTRDARRTKVYDAIVGLLQFDIKLT